VSALATAMWVLSGIIWSTFVLVVVVLVMDRVRRRRRFRYFAEVLDSVGLTLQAVVEDRGGVVTLAFEVKDGPQYGGSPSERLAQAAVLVRLNPPR
jgi:uncharacterized membrane protein YeiH